MSQPPDMEQMIKHIRDGLINTVQDLQEVVQKGNNQLSRCSQSINLVNQALTAITALQQTNAQLLQENFRLDCIVNQLKAQVKHFDSRYNGKSTVNSTEGHVDTCSEIVNKEELKAVFNAVLQSNIIETDEHGTFSSSPDRFGEICADIVLSVLQGVDFQYNRTFQSLVLSNIRSVEPHRPRQTLHKKRGGNISSASDTRMHTGMSALAATAVAMDQRKKNRKTQSNAPLLEMEVSKKRRSFAIRDQLSSMDNEIARSNLDRNVNSDGAAPKREAIELDDEPEFTLKTERPRGKPRKRAIVKEGVKKRKRRQKQESNVFPISEAEGSRDENAQLDIEKIEREDTLTLQTDAIESELVKQDANDVLHRKVAVLPRRAGETLSDQEYRVAVLDYYSKFVINSLQYAQNNNNLRLRYQVKLRSDRYVSASEFLRVLCAEPWRECRKDFPVYQMIDLNKAGPRLKAFLQLNAQLLNDNISLIAHWERQHWLILPKYEEWPDDDPEKVFFSNYEKSRDVRHNHLKHKRVQIDSHWRRLISDGEVATGILFDPAYFWITDTRAPWLPTRHNLIVDLIEIDYLHPSRTHFTLNPYASAFYHEQLDLIIPPPPPSAESLLQILPPISNISEFFTPLKSEPAPQWRNANDEFSKHCRDQWIELWNLACSQVDANMQSFPRYNQFPREWSSAHASFMLQKQGMIMSGMMDFSWFRCAYYDTKCSRALKVPQEPDQNDPYDLEELQDLAVEKTTRCYFWPTESGALAALLKPYEQVHDSL